MPGLISRLRHRLSSTRDGKKRPRSKKAPKPKRVDGDDISDGDDGDARLLDSPLSTETSFTIRTGSSAGLPPTLHRQDPRQFDDSSDPTFDPDYRHIHCGNYSLSDAGGTVGTHNQSLACFSHAGASAFGSVAPSVAHLGASPGPCARHDYHRTGQQCRPPSPASPGGGGAPARTEVLELVAPPGKLGLVIDTPAGAATPVVHAVKDTCPLRGSLRVDDALVAVDGVDVRDYSPAEVSRLIGRNSDRARRLTLVRTTREHGAGGMGDNLFRC